MGQGSNMAQPSRINHGLVHHRHQRHHGVSMSSMEPPLKRSRSDGHDTPNDPESLSRPISPPPQKRPRHTSPPKPLPSPWKLTWIRDLPDEMNKDATTLHDILGDPLISECWIFNYLHDIDFILDALDPDVKQLVQVHIVHGFWKREDRNRLMLVEDASIHPSVHLHAAFMPEPFGTHHSKLMVLFRHDDTAQIVIHTANMISKDWTNMTNAVWQSPRLPRLNPGTDDTSSATSSPQSPLGSGARFRSDFLSYLRAYDKQRRTCKDLSEKLSLHDFSGIKAAFVASVPGVHEAHDLSQTTWGWASIRRCLREIASVEGESTVVAQISSIATLGAKDDWIQKTLFKALAASKTTKLKRPKFSVVFPTADEIRRSLDGYASGGSIHTKTQSAQQAKQLQYLRPLFCHWANDSADGLPLPVDAVKSEAGRQRAAPHIKTFIRYNEKGTLDWALLTSANLSKQAWGDAERSTGELRICSWETGVLVWPALFDAEEMVPTFGTDTLQEQEVKEDDCKPGQAGLTVGVRIPYDLPLQSYGPSEEPWVATQSYSEPDCLGRTWDTWTR